MKNKTLLFCMLVFGQQMLFGQDFSNKGKDFWLGYGFHVNMGAGVSNAQNNAQDMVLYFTSDKNANVTVEIPGVGYSQAYVVTANQVTISNTIPKAGVQDARINSVGTFDRGIHITSDVPIVAYAHIYNASVSGASLLFPTNTLGKDYYSVIYTQSSNASFANSFFFVVATEDNTSIEITPSAANVNGLAVGVPSSPIPLKKGQIYSVMGTTTGTLGSDLTGSRIRSISANNSVGCKKIAVFAGAGKMSIGGAGANGSADNLFAQAFPSVAWGKKYLTAPTGSQPNNFYRVCVSDPTTIVKLNGVVLPTSSLVGNFYYQFKNSNTSGTNLPLPNLIESDKPVLVAQYCTTQGQEGNLNTTPFGDPEMIYLSPVEQTINNITLYSANRNAILQSFINVIIKNSGVASFTLDGVTKVSSFAVHPQESAYSFATFPVSSGSHTLYSDTGFNAIAYGFGNAESYGYNAGTNVRDFTPVATFQNPFNRIDSAVTCVNTPLRFSVPLTFVPNTIKWDFSAAPSINPNTNIGPLSSFTTDSTRIVNGKTLNYYSTNTIYTFSKSNTAALRDTIKLYTTSATPDGCGSTDQVFTIPVSVNEVPTARFTLVNTGCAADSVRYKDSSSIGSGALKTWAWNFGDGTTANLNSGAQFAKKYASGGSFDVKLNVISDIGCASLASTQTIQISSKPDAKFSYSTLKCVNGDITFSDASSSAVGVLAKWTWNLDNGSPAYSNTTNAAQTTKYTSSGTKNITLQVETTTGCKSDVFTPVTSLVVNPLPDAGFILPEVCLNDASATFTDTSKVSNGASINAYLWNFNAGSPAVTPGPDIVTSTLKNPIIKYKKSADYTVSLTVTSTDGCITKLNQAFTVNGTTPKADFEITNTGVLCTKAPILLKNKSFVDFGNLTKLEIYWDFTNNPTQKETDQDPTPNKLYPHFYTNTTTAGKSFDIKVVAYSGGSSCVNTITKSIVVYPSPKAFFTASASQICYGDIVNFEDKSNGISSPIVTWVWDLGGGDMSGLQNPKKQYNDSGLIDVSFYFLNGDGCISDTVGKKMTVYPNPKLTLQHNTKVLEGGTIIIKPIFVYGNELLYKWTPPTYLSSDTSVAPKAIPLDDITYTLTLTAKGDCIVSDTIFIKVLKGPEVPNVFSPNGDGINDTWNIKYLESYIGATVEVYNRYGQIIYRSIGYDIPWNGNFNGNPLSVGTYYYIINPKNGRKQVSGSVTIIK